MRLKPSARLALAAAIALLSACAQQLPEHPTLADLPEPVVPRQERPIEVIDLARIEAHYQEALAVATAPAVRQHILLRLADLEMTRAEQAQQASGSLDEFYGEPITRYRELIDAYEADPAASVVATPDALYYKLAKAYALDGKTGEASATLNRLADRFPDSPYLHEAQFRRAERAFAEGDYTAAETLYAGVAADKSSAFGENAHYMQGWAAYKQARYLDALDIFSNLLDKQFAGALLPNQVDNILSAQSPTERNLTDDTLRVMSYAFANLDGAASIAELQRERGGRAYQHLLYDNLGNLYLAQKRYLDSADTFRLFVENNPDADLAPDFSIREIEVYEAGGFPSMVLPAKRAFVERYGIYSNYWQARAGIPAPVNTPESRTIVRATTPRTMSPVATARLRQYLEELARHEHAAAQQLASSTAAGGAEAPGPTEVRRAFSAAARWYREFVLTFPEDPKAPELLFLLAEALEQGGETIEALGTYEQVAFTRRDPVYGADAGYSAVLLAGALVERSTRGEVLDVTAEPIQSALWQWQERKIDNALKFAQYYPSDERAVGVLTAAAPELLYQGRLPEASTAARQVITWEPSPPGELLYTAWLTLGHAEFDLGHYQAAEAAYWQTLKLHPEFAGANATPTQSDIKERIAASLYKQAEAEMSAGNTTGAIALWLTIDSDLPATTIAAQALFDAGTAAQLQGDWPQAEQLLKRFEARYPGHPLAERLPTKLVAIYENQQNWAAAAASLSALALASNDPEQARQASLTAAEYYDKAGNWEAARDHYRNYAHTYSEPVAERIEVEQRLADMYAEINDTTSRDFWLKKLVAGYRSSDAPSERQRYLAAGAASALAEAPYQQFLAVPLTLPLDKSLARKQKALKEAITAQENVLSYKVADFTTRANYQIGEIYAALSRDLMDSERPDNLGPLELEQYDILLEEEAFPFEEKAIDLHEANARRAWQGIYDDWVKSSIQSLARLLPARFGKREQTEERADEIY